MSEFISSEEKKKVEAAISSAEKHTSAEIYAVLAERSDDYRFIAYGYLAFWIFVVGALLSVLFEWQTVSDWHADVAVNVFPVAYFLWAQLLAFILGILVFRYFPSIVKFVVPVHIAHERAHANAVKQFLAHGIQNTKNRNGILIFVSLQEQYGEILVDSAIEGAIGREYFLENVEVMLKTCETGNIGKAFEETITQLGEKLATAFPCSARNKNEIADKMIII